MRYLALASDYDNTLATEGRVADPTRAALGRLRASGRRVILVTGRRLDDLLHVCDCIDLFDYVVAENGALVYDPRSRDVTLLADPPPEPFIAALRRRGVQPLEIGNVIVATHAPQETVVLEIIRELGLELQVIFNREAVMVLPAGVNKASGMKLALRNLGMSAHEVVAIGDAENDHSFMHIAECPVAVANAVDSIKAMAACVTAGAAGDGVIELIDALVANDLAAVDARLTRRHIALGTRLDGTTVWLPPYGNNLLIAGPSGSGKSTLATALLERFAEHLYQVCVIDPEGDYVSLRMLVTIGDQQRAPGISEIMAVLRDPYVHANANLLGVPLADRPAYFADLLPHLRAMRTRTGRPHWLLIDEAHHLLPEAWGHVPERFNESILVTVHPERLVPSLVASVDVVIAVGASPDKTLREFAAAIKRRAEEVHVPRLEQDQVACWFVHSGEAPFPMSLIPGKAERVRHHRKYAEGDVRYRSFYFRGPTGKHNLKAQNLSVFCQIAAGIGEETWMFHLRRNDYSRWMRDVIKNRDLAAAVEDIERRVELDPAQTRALVCAAVETRYTLPE
jgi:hydroxymethylpyrimidine pyrophosphatase-like HAD family hydrolase/energy-coupling factor transporter ATP-binding protein EcfA2